MRWRVPIEAKATFTGYLLIESRTPQDAVRIAETVRAAITLARGEKETT